MPEQQNTLAVEVVDTWEAFHALRPEWEALSEADPAGSLFLDWQWLAEAFRGRRFRWTVLAVRLEATGQLQAILPLKYRVHWSRSRQEFHSELEAGGRLIGSPVSGFLCVQGAEAACARALASQLDVMPWVKLSLRYITPELRANALGKACEDLGFSFKTRSYTSSDGAVNYLLMPQLALPRSEQDFLEAFTDQELVRKYHRFMRKDVGDGAYELHLHATGTSSEMIKEAIACAQATVGANDMAPRSSQEVGLWADQLTAAQTTDDVLIVSLTEDAQIVGALLCVLDAHRGVVHLLGCAGDMHGLNGLLWPVLMFQTLTWTIAQGYEVFDFGGGNQPAKYLFADQAKHTQDIQIRRTAYNPHLVFDTIGCGQALERIATYIEDGKTERALAATRQLAKHLS